jgi:hypothetical protein
MEVYAALLRQLGRKSDARKLEAMALNINADNL